MTDLPDRPDGGSSRGLWILIYCLLAPAVVLPLAVPLYDQAGPELFGFPFYYWFQFALILLAAVLTLSAYVVSTKADARDRAARRDREAGR
ncbi:MAG: DUF3311 domain-containing protein [Nocardioides sp.]